jgi:hypothetical protein
MICCLKNKHKIRSFLGLCMYYRRFISGFANIAKPLTTLTEETGAFESLQKWRRRFKHLRSLSVLPLFLLTCMTTMLQQTAGKFVLQISVCGPWFQQNSTHRVGLLEEPSYLRPYYGLCKPFVWSTCFAGIVAFWAVITCRFVGGWTCCLHLRIQVFASRSMAFAFKSTRCDDTVWRMSWKHLFLHSACSAFSRQPTRKYQISAPKKKATKSKFNTLNIGAEFCRRLHLQDTLLIENINS